MDNITYCGLHVGQIVHVKSKQYTGLARLTGTPPQGTGIYAVGERGQKLWLDAADIREARLGDTSR